MKIPPSPVLTPRAPHRPSRPESLPAALEPRVFRRVPVRWIVGLLALSILPASATDSAPFHRVLWNGRVLSTNEWDLVARMGFTLVHSDGGHVPTLLQMMDQAHRHGIRMIAGAPQPRAVPWLSLSVDASASKAPPELWPHVVQHYTQSAPSLILYGKGLPGLAEGLPLALNDPAQDTIGELAARITALGSGVVATVLPGKADMPSLHLATGWYGNAAVAPVVLNGGEIAFFDGATWSAGEAQYRHYVQATKDHPALHAYAPFDDTDIGPYSPAFQRFIRGKIRTWAPKAPVYLLVSDLGRSGGTFEHDHKIAPEAFDGLVLYSYPHDWEGTGTWRDVNSLRSLLQEWAHTPHAQSPKEILHLVAGFAQDGGPWTLPPPHAMRMEWEAIQRSDVPLAGFGYYAWDGHSTTLGNSPYLQQEAAAVNAVIITNHVELSVTPASRRIAAEQGEATFQADIRGGRPPFTFEWDFGDGTRAWGSNPTHRFSGPGTYPVQCLTRDADGRQHSRAAEVFILGLGTSLVDLPFEDGFRGGFITASGAWSFANGVIRQTDAASQEARAFLPTSAGPQYTVEADFRLTGDRESLSVFYAGAAQGSDFQVDIEPLQEAVYAREGLTCRIGLQADTGRTHRYAPVQRGDWHRLAVDVLADHVLVSLDGQLLLRSRQNRHGGDGVVGVGAKGLAGEFDNFRIIARTPLELDPAATRSDPSGRPERWSFDPGLVGGTPPFTYRWTFGDGSPPSDVPKPEHDFPATGVFPVTLEVRDVKGAVRGASMVLLAGGTIVPREAVDYDWSDGSSPGFPTVAAPGQALGAGQDGRRRVDFFQAVIGQGDQSLWRDSGEVSLASNPIAGGVVIGWTSPGDWWNYTFAHASEGMARLRLQVSAEYPSTLRLFAQDRPIGDVLVPAKGGSNWQWVESTTFPLPGGRSTIRLQVLDGPSGASLNLARLELHHVPGPDVDRDGIMDAADWDRDGDGFSDTDEATRDQSDPGASASTPVDTDGDRVSDLNDPDDDGDGTPDVGDASPLIANSAPVLREIDDQVIRVGEPLDLSVQALDTDVPPQAVLHQLSGDSAPGLSLTPDGRLSWTPSRAEENQTFVVTITATDSGAPPLSSKRTIRIRVDPGLEPGYEAVQIDTSDGPATVVVPRRKFAFEASNRTLYLSASGADANPGTLDAPWRTFSHAVAKLEPGDVLYVRGGVYAEPFEVRTIGRPGRPVVISAYPGERVKIVEPDGWRDTHRDGALITLHDCWWVWLHGFEIVGSWRYGNAYMPGFGGSCVVLAGEGNRLLNCIVRLSYDTGIDLRWGNCLAEGNVVLECGTPWEGRGIGIGGNPDDRSIVRGNITLRCSGINMNYGYGAHVYNNLVVDPPALGLSGSASRLIAAHNVIARSRSMGLHVGREFGTNSFVNNVFFDSAPWHVYFDDQAGEAAHLALGNSFDFNLLDPDSAIARPSGWFAAWAGQHLIHANPQFQDAGRNDFRLRPTSPARNAATEVRLLGARRYPDLGIFPASYYWQPDLAPLPETPIPEGEESTLPLSFAVPNPEASDVTLEWLDPPPPGLVMDAKRRTLTWKPSELQGPGSYTLRLLAVAEGSPLLSSVSTLTLRVRDVNSPPTTRAIPDQTVSEGETLRLDLGLPDVGHTPGLQRQVFSAIDGAGLGDLTNSVRFPDGPSSSTVQSTFEAPRDVGDNYGQRMRGFVVPPETGEYTFWIASDDASVLKLSPTVLPADARVIALVAGWTDFRQWTKEPNQKSAAIPLEAGRPYYVEALMKEGGGGDHLSVRWQLPSGIFQTPIPQASLRAWVKEPVYFAIDSDVPSQSLTYSIDPHAPAGASIDPATGTLLWNPGEDQGPGTHRITVRVADDADPPSSSEQTFTVTVVEANTRPALAAVGDQAVDELDALTLALTATDADLPAQELSFDLVSPTSPNAVIDPVTGVFRFRPAEDQGPGVHPFTVRVTDNGAPPLEDLRTFVVTVREVNTAPELSEIADRTVEVGTRLRFSVTALDADFPVNSLKFALGVGAPDGAQITPAGAFTWSPTEAQGGAAYPIPVTVTDDGTPPLSDTSTFNVTVAAVQGEIRLIGMMLSAGGRFSFSWIPQAGRTYRVQAKVALADSDWADVQPTLTTAGGLTTCTVSVVEATQRYYRVLQQP